MDLHFLKDVPTIMWCILGIIILAIVVLWRKKDFKIGGLFSAKTPQKEKDTFNNVLGHINLGDNRDGHIGDVYNTYLEIPKEAIIIGELCITKTCKRLVVKNIGDGDAQNIDFVCSDLDVLLNNERKKFPIKSLPAKTSISVRVLFLTRSPSMYEVEWIYEDSNRNKIIKKQTVIK